LRRLPPALMLTGTERESSFLVSAPVHNLRGRCSLAVEIDRSGVAGCDWSRMDARLKQHVEEVAMGSMFAASLLAGILRRLDSATDPCARATEVGRGRTAAVGGWAV
jgi:hypothetical protein